MMSSLDRTAVAELEVFLAIAKHGTVRQAAESLGRTQPALSARIQTLEATWGVRLFRREPRGMRLTPEGRRLLPHAEAALGGIDRLDQEARGKQLDSTELRIGAGDALGREVLPRALSKVIKSHEGLAVQLREGPGPVLLSALANGEIDLALVVASEVRGQTGLDAETILNSTVELLVPSGHELATRKRVRLQQLAEVAWVTLPRGSGFRAHLERAAQAAEISLRADVEVGNLSLVRRFVAAGLGVAAVPSIAFRGERLAGVTRLQQSGIPSVDYARCLRQGVEPSRAAQNLLDVVSLMS